MMLESKSDVVTDILTSLFLRPSSTDITTISPPVETRQQKLPFNELTWENFERLCVRIIAIDKTIVKYHRYGVQGEEQKGIDLLAERHVDSRVELWCFQCKKYGKFKAGQLKAALDRIMFEANEYVVIISSDARAVLRDMAKQRPNTDLWDAEDLSRILKNQHDIVEDFFGLPWTRAFCGPRPTPEGALPKVTKKVVGIELNFDLIEVDRHKREELINAVAATLNIKPEEVVIKVIIEGSVRIVLELPTPQAEELLSLYSEQNPKLNKVIEQFRIVKIEDLEPPSAPSGSGGPGPSGPEGSPDAPISGETAHICVDCGERFTLDKLEKEYQTMTGVGLVPRTPPVHCKRHRRERSQQAKTLGRRNFNISNAASGEGCFQCFTTADLPEVASWRTTHFSWEKVVPSEPVDSPNTVKLEIDYQIAGVLALEEAPEGQLRAKSIEYAPWIDHYTNARKALPLYLVAESIRRGYGGAFSIDIRATERQFYESLGFQRVSGTNLYYLPATTAYRLVLREEGIDNVSDFST